MVRYCIEGGGAAWVHGKLKCRGAVVLTRDREGLGFLRRAGEVGRGLGCRCDEMERCWGARLPG